MLTISHRTDDSTLPVKSIDKDVFSLIMDFARFRSNTKFVRSHNLLSVSCTGCKYLNDRGVLTLCSGCPNLFRLYLNGCSSISDAAIDFVAKSLKKLRCLNVSNCNGLTDKCKGLKTAIVRLDELKMCNIPKISDEFFMSALVHERVVYGWKKKDLVSNLKTFDISDLNVSSNVFHWSLCKFRNVVSIRLADLEHLDDQGLLSFSAISSPLQSLDISGCRNVTDRGLIPLLENSTGLRSLNISHTGATFDTVVQGLSASMDLHQVKALSVGFMTFGNKKSLHRLTDSLCNSAPRLEDLAIDEETRNSILPMLTARMKRIMRDTVNPYGNIAYGCKRVKQSSHCVDKSRGAQYATDGDKSSVYGEAWFCPTATTTITAIEAEAFLEVDLGRPEWIHSIRVTLPDDKYGTALQFPLYVMCSKKPFSRTVEECITCPYMVRYKLFEEVKVGLKLEDLPSPIRYIRVQQVGRPRCLSVGQVAAFRKFRFFDKLRRENERKLSEREFAYKK